MKKKLALCLAGVMGLACFGLAACDAGKDEEPAATVGNFSSIVSDKIETDEQWDKAMWDTVTYLYDFQGEDGPSKVYDKDPYWYPSSIVNNIGPAIDSNYKIEYSSRLDYGPIGGAHQEKFKVVADGGKFYVYTFTKDFIDAYVDELEEYFQLFQSLASDDYDEDSEKHVRKYIKWTDPDEDDGHTIKIGVWHSEPDWEGSGLVYMDFWTENSFPFIAHFDIRRDRGDAFFEEHPSVLEFAKYDEEKKGYVISDKELLTNLFGISEESENVDMQLIYKFKKGKLIGVEIEQNGENMSRESTIAFTYGGQTVTFPDGLPWDEPFSDE